MIKNAIIILLVVLSVWLVFRKPPVIKQEITPAAKELVKAEVKNVNDQIDAKGFKHAVIDAVQNVVSSDKQLDSSAIRQRDSVTKLLNIKDKQLTQWMSYSATLEGKIMQATKTDTGFRYQDQYANIEYIRGKDTTGSGHFNFKYNADINYAEYWKRKHFLAPKKHYIDFWISDPRATINTVKRMKFEVKDPTFGLDVSGKAMYNGVDRSMYVGGEMGVDIGKLNLSGSYLYSPAVGKWYPFVSGKYKLIDF